MQLLQEWRNKLKRSEDERRAVGESMEVLEDWRTKQKQQQSRHNAPHCHSQLRQLIESEDVREVDVLVKCIGSGLLQAAGVSALFSAGCWWGLSRVRGMTPVRKVLLTAVNGATSAFVSLNWSMSSCHEAFLSHPTSAVAARTRTLVRSKLPDHPLLAPFTAEEDERLGRGELAMGSDDFLPPPPQRA